MTQRRESVGGAADRMADARAAIGARVQTVTKHDCGCTIYTDGAPNVNKCLSEWRAIFGKQIAK